MTIKKIAPIIIMATLFILYSEFCSDYTEKMYKTNVKIFDDNDINGIITMIEGRNKGAAFKIESSNQIYIFYPRTDKILNKGNNFLNFAEPVDSIAKEANSDTLYLYKNNAVYRYTFQRW